MPRADHIQTEGTVLETLPNALFRVQHVDNPEHVILCTLSGKTRLSRIKITVGDKVKIEVNAYDLSRGRIVYRSKS